MKYNNYDWFDYNDASICNCVRDTFFYKMWIDEDNDDWNMCKVNLFSKLFIFMKTRINDLINWISSFTFIFFINKNDSKGESEDEDINFSIVKWWETFTWLIKIRSKKRSLFFWYQMILKTFIMRSFDNNMR